MASLSLPRVLQLKKNSLDAEREQFEKFQTLAIQKAINAIETPVKEKHVRSTIIGTFQEQSAITYWMVAIRLPLQDNRIVSWKFCHVTHKLLREGHPACLDDSQRHIGMIENLGKLWVHLREGYGKLVHLYCNLLVCKLRFHARNPRFPGNMQLTADELDAIAENDVNNYFQLCVELFDYMDDILNLQAAVFDSLGNARANSMTASGQCRLAALIPCAQDSSHIYDCNVRLLFRLHAALPQDTLAGHRDRFRQQFKKLSSFYKHASSLQYYRNLLTLPILPSNPPNFLLQSDFGTYVAPVVSIPEPAPDEVDLVGSLIDTSDTISQSTFASGELESTRASPSPPSPRSPPSPQPDPVLERDKLIDHLQNELKRMRSEVSQLVQERNSMLGSMREHCTRIESQLQSAKVQLEEEKQKAIVLSAETPQIKQKLTETEEKAKITDEKFQKLKGAYTQLREEHITLIRQKAEVDKMTASLRAAAAQHESAKTSLQQQLNDRMKDVELLQQSASSSDEIEAYKNEISSLRNDLEQSRQKELELETLKASMEALEIEHKTANAEQQEKLTTAVNELKEASENLQKLKLEKEEKESELTKVKEDLVGLQEKSGDEFKKVVEEKEEALKQVSELTQKYQQEKEELGRSISNLQADVEIFQQKFKDAQSHGADHDKQVKEYQSKNEQLTKKLENKDAELKQTVEKLNALQQDITEIKHANDSQINEQIGEIERLTVKLAELMKNIDDNKGKIKDLETLNIETESKLSETINEQQKLQALLNEKENKLTDYESKIIHLSDNHSDSKATFEELIETKNKDILEIKNQLREITEKKDREIQCLQEAIQKKTELYDLQLSDNEKHIKTISDLESNINDKINELTNLSNKYDDMTKYIESQKHTFEDQLKDKQRDLTIFVDKIQNATSSKQEIISSLKTMITEKDKQVIDLNVEVSRLSRDVVRLEDELQEAQAEIDIGQSELLTLKEEHEAIVDKNERNLILKNKELRDLNEQVVKLKGEISELQSEKDSLLKTTNSDKMILETKLKELEESYKELTIDYEVSIKDIKTKLHSVMLENDNFKGLKSNEINELKIKHENEVKERDYILIQNKDEMEKMRIQIIELEKTKTSEMNEVTSTLIEKENENKILEVRLEHIEREKLTAECELQDLLQHNTVLETDLVAAKRKLEDMQMELEKERSRVLSCAGAAALEVTDGALAALDRGRDALPAAAEDAASALEQIEAHTEVKGNEETLAKLMIAAAHNTAQLSSYVTEVFITSTDVDLHDKLNNECRELLQSTRQCVQAASGGAGGEGGAGGAAGRARALAARAAAAASATPRSVDDELADMDTAIEHAALQIEELLAASRAGDSGVKLEVNGKILDACTTLMSAVKALVQDARRLQQELGDNKTRQKMYRNNPQWREGLISAAKAVVFAAKLLVSSADEAVGSAGRVEGVSAAAHEVAGSTAQLVAASRARAPPAAPALARLTAASRAVAAATGAVVAAVRSASSLLTEQDTLDTSTLTLTATRILEMESKVRALELETALDAERARLAALRKRHYHLAQQEENGNMTNGKE